LSTSIEKFILEKLWPLLSQWNTKKGYGIVCLLAVFAAWYFQFLFLLSGLLVLAFVLLLWSVSWYFLSGRYVFPSPSRKTVVLCFSVDAEGQRNQKRVVKAVQVKLNDLNLMKKIKLRVIAPDVIADKAAAHSYREKTGVDLVVWGRSIFGSVDSRNVAQYEVFHTFRITDALRTKLELFIADVGIILLKRRWEISEANELSDIRVLADNLFESCLFIIGLYYYSEEYFNDAAKVLEAILPSLDVKDRKSPTVESQIQAGRVRALLAEIYFIQSRIAHDEGDYPTSISLLERIQPIVPNKIPVLIMLARTTYLSGDIFRAQRFTESIRRVDKKHPAVCINNAFFGILQKNYERTRFWYDILLKHKAMQDVDPFSVITFLDEEYGKHPSEHAFLYALGIVNGYFDPSTRKGNLQRFLRLTKNRNEYEVLRRRAMELLAMQNR
jgi:hypothetical protein